MPSDKRNDHRHGSGSSSGEGRSPAMPARSSGRAMKKANDQAHDPRLTSSSDVANFGEATTSAAVVRSAAAVRTNPIEYVDPEIPSSSMASASSGEANHSRGIVNLNTPPRPYIHDAYRDSKSAFNREFRMETPPGFPSRVDGKPHFLDESAEYWRQQQKRCDRHAYEDGFISAEEFNRRRQRIRAEAGQPKYANAGSSRAVDAAASETTAIVGTDIGASDFPSVVSSGVTDGTTAPATSTVNAVQSPESTDDILNTGFAASGTEMSQNASTVEPSDEQLPDANNSIPPTQASMELCEDVLNTGFVLSGADNTSTASTVESASKQTPDHPSINSSINSQPAGHETREMSADLMRGEEVLEGEDAENFCAVIRFRPRHQQDQHQHVEANRSMSSVEEDDDEMQDLSTSFAMIGLIPESPNAEEDVDVLSESLAIISFAADQQDQQDSESSQVSRASIMPTQSFNTTTVESNNQHSAASLTVLAQPVIVPVIQSLPSTQMIAPEEQVTDTKDVVEAMEVDEVLEAMDVDKVFESMDVDQVAEEHDTDFEMFDETIVSTQSDPIIGSNQLIQPSQNVVLLQNSGLFSSTNMEVIEMMEVDPVKTPEEERSSVNERHSASISHEALVPNQPSASETFETNKKIESNEVSSSMPVQPAPPSSVALTSTPEVTIQNLHPSTVLSSVESSNESPSIEQGPAPNERPSRERVNQIVAHHRRRALMSPTTRFSPHHSVMKRRSITTQRSRLALICNLNRQRNQQAMIIKPYKAVETNPLSDIVAHHRRQHELKAATPVSLSNCPTTTGQASRLALIEAQRATTQTAPKSNVDRVPSAANTDVTSNVIPASAAAVEQNTIVVPSPRHEQVNDVSSGSAIEERTFAVNASGSKIRRMGRPQYTDLERAFAKQRQRAPITRQELEVMFALAERFNNTREAADAIPTTSQQRQSPTSGSPTEPQQQRRPFQGRVTRLWLSMQNDGRPVRRAVQRPSQFYSNEESPIRRKQEGEECKARPAAINVALEDRSIEEAQDDRESSVASTSQPPSTDDQFGELTSSTVVSNTPRKVRRYRDSVRRNRDYLQYEADSEGEDAHIKSKKKVNKRSHKKGLPKCKCTHPEHLKYSCNHAVHDVMKEIARKYLICRWCDLPYARRLITSEDERSESEDEGGNEDHDVASSSNNGPQVPPVEERQNGDVDDSQASQASNERPLTPVEAHEEFEDIVPFEHMPDPEEEFDVVEGSRQSTPVEASQEHEDVVQFEPMSDPEEGFDVVELLSSRESSQKRRNSTSSSDDDHIPTKRPRRDVYVDSSVDGDTDNESHHLPSDNDDDAPQPPPPTIRRARPDPNAPKWGRLTHITELEGINLPDAPRVVSMRNLIVPDYNQLTADLQTLVVSGENFQAAWYEVNGVVVLLGPFNGTVVASKELQEAVNQPIILMHNPDDPIKQVAAGPNHLVMLGKSGRIYAVGCAKDGQLGVAHPEKYRNSSITPSALLRCVYDEDGNEVTFKTIRVEGNRTVGITEDGSEYSCGHEVGDLFVQTL